MNLKFKLFSDKEINIWPSFKSDFDWNILINFDLTPLRIIFGILNDQIQLYVHSKLVFITSLELFHPYVYQIDRPEDVEDVN